MLKGSQFKRKQTETNRSVFASRSPQLGRKTAAEEPAHTHAHTQRLTLTHTHTHSLYFSSSQSHSEWWPGCYTHRHTDLLCPKERSVGMFVYVCVSACVRACVRAYLNASVSEPRCRPLLSWLEKQTPVSPQAHVETGWQGGWREK